MEDEENRAQWLRWLAHRRRAKVPKKGALPGFPAIEWEPLSAKDRARWWVGCALVAVPFCPFMALFPPGWILDLLFANALKNLTVWIISLYVITVPILGYWDEWRRW
jgi:hypothetical protein